MRKLFFILLSVIACSMSLSAQTVTYHGMVVDEATGEPLIGATVMPIGTGRGVATDYDGKFTLNIPSKVKEVQVSYVGYTTIRTRIANNITIKLKTSAATLDDVMVVAFGTTTKEAFTGSAAVVNSKDLQTHTTSNVADALVGSVPGLQMRSTSGSPGNSGSIKIRGISSIYSSTDPLIIVDGAPYPNSLNTIPQSDIASISVLKDAASAALYGARGAAGVIIVTTKKGSDRDSEIKVTARWGQNSRAVQDYDVIKSPAEWYETYYTSAYNYFLNGKGETPEKAWKDANVRTLRDAVYNVFSVPDGEMLIGQNGKINPKATLGNKIDYRGEKRYLIPDDWAEEGYKTGLRQEYGVSLNGGNERSSFYASLNYLNDNGILIPSKFDRINARVRADYRARKWLKIGANMSYTHSNSVGNPGIGTGGSAGNIMYFVGCAAPIYPVYVRSYDENGNPYIMQGEGGFPRYDYGVGTYTNTKRPFTAPGNPIGSQAVDKTNTIYNGFNGTLNATVTFTDYLKLDVTSNVNWSDRQATYFGSMYNDINSAVNGKLSKTNYIDLRTNNTQTLTFDKDFNGHRINAMLGHEYYRDEGHYLFGQAEGGFSAEITELAAFANRQINTTSYKSNYNVEGYFGSVQYNFNEKYYGSVSYRRDASSKFDKKHRWGNFWSVGGAWIITKEKFMEKTSKWLDFLKLKVSIGQQGNDNLGNTSAENRKYSWTTILNLTIADKNHMSPVFNGTFANPKITWETTTNFNAGFEFGFFSNRLSGNIDFYNKHTNNLLFLLSVPESLGGSGYYGNMGAIRNTGVELSLTGAIIRLKDYDWTISMNLSHNRNKILSLPKDKTMVNGGFFESPCWYEEGGPLYNYMTYAFAGVSDKGEALYYYDPNLIDSEGGMITSRPGKVKDPQYVTNNTGKASRYAVGCVLPKVFGGFSTSVRIKWFDITAIFDYSIGGKIMDQRYASLMGPNTSLSGGNGWNYHKDIHNAWTPENHNSEIPRFQLGDRYTNTASDRFLTNASYLNFQAFTVGFTFPKFWKEIKHMRVFVSGENLCFWSKRKGFDPRYSFTGNVSVGSYSPMRTISGGLEVTF